MQHKIPFLLVAACCLWCLAGSTALAQKKDDINSRINRLMEDYSLYSDLTEDGAKISNRYKEQFRELFANDAEVYNDLPTTPTYNTAVKIDKYISTFTEWFPKGISTSYSNRKIMDRGKPVEGNFVGKYDTVYLVSVSKTINGRNKDKEKIEPKATALFLVVGYKRSEDKLIILNIQNKYQEARFLLGLPGKYEGKGSIETQKYIKSRPLFISLGIMPGFSNISAATADIGVAYSQPFGEALTQSGGFGWAANAQFVVGLSKRIALGVGIGASHYRSALSADSYIGNDTITDADGKTGVRHTTISNFKETYSQTYLQIPVFLRLNAIQNNRFKLFVNIGLAPGFSIGAAHNYSGSFSASNQYTSPHQYTLNELINPSGTYDEAHNTHLGLYENLTTDSPVPDAGKPVLSSSNLMALGGIGASFAITDKVSVFGAGAMYYGLSNLQQEAQTTTQNWVNALHYSSLYRAAQKMRTTMGGVEIGIIYTLRK